MKKLTKLTEEQEALLPQQRDKWIKIGLSTDPLDFENAKAAAIDAYKAAGLEPPKMFFRFQSPLSAALGAAMLKKGNQVWDQVGNQVRDQVGDQVRNQVRDQVGDQVRNQVWGQVWGQVGDQVYGAQDAGWLSFYETFLRFGISAAEKLQPLMRLALYCGWWAPYSNIVIFQDRPELILFDDQKRLHCETGPSVKYPDGFSVYSWHGVRVPGKWIEDKKTLTAQEALSVNNMEQRRAACEILGWDNILVTLGAVVIDKHSDPQIGELVEVEIPDIGLEKFLRVQCGTMREFAIPVPPQVKTAHEANAWTWGLKSTEYNPEVRT